MPPRATLTPAELEAMLDRAAERGAALVLQRLGCPTDPAEATIWLADAQNGVRAVKGVRGWLAAAPAKIANAILLGLALSMLGAAVIAAKGGWLHPPAPGGEP